MSWTSLHDQASQYLSYFFSVSGSSVRIYSSSTGELISTLLASPDTSEYGGSHSDRVTAAILNPFAPLQLLTSSLDGLIKIWDFMDGTLLQTLDVGSPITHMCACKKTQGHVFVAVTPPSSAEKSEGMYPVVFLSQCSNGFSSKTKGINPESFSERQE